MERLAKSGDIQHPQKSFSENFKLFAESHRLQFFEAINPNDTVYGPDTILRVAEANKAVKECWSSRKTTEYTKAENIYQGLKTGAVGRDVSCHVFYWLLVCFPEDLNTIAIERRVFKEETFEEFFGFKVPQSKSDADRCYQSFFSERSDSKDSSVDQSQDLEPANPLLVDDDRGSEDTKETDTEHSLEAGGSHFVQGENSAQTSSKPKRRVYSLAALSVTVIAAVIFCVAPFFSEARVGLGEHLSGTAQAKNVTYLTQFDRQHQTFSEDLLASLGLRILEHESRNGSSRATHQLGMAKLLGINTTKDIDASVLLFKEAHEAGYDPASNSYAYSLHRGLGPTYDPQKSLAIYEELSERKVAKAINSLGLFYKNGEIKPYNPLLALKLFKEAASLGDSYATYNIARLLRDGVPGQIDQDTEGAKSAFAKAVEGGVESAASPLAWLYLQSGETKKAVEMLEVEARRKNTSAMTYLARQLWSGNYVPRDLQRARELFEEATARGNPYAAFTFADFIEEVGPDSEKERIPSLLQFASSNGNSQTLMELGFRAEHDPDLVGRAKIAEKHYQRSSDLGHGRAAYRLAEMILDGRLHERPRQDAIDLLERSVSRGNPYAQWKLATILLDPEIEPTDRVKGIRMLRTAGERGDGWVTNRVGIVFAVGDLVKQDDREASEWYRKAFDRNGNIWAACNYVRRQTDLNPNTELQTYDSYLQAATDATDSYCLSFLFSDIERLETWSKSVGELEEILGRYIDAGNANAVRFLAKIRTSGLVPPGVSLPTKEQYFELLERAAQNGSIDAMLQIGTDSFSWNFVDDGTNDIFQIPDDVKIHWLREAASNGAFEAISHLNPREFNVEPEHNWFDRLIHQTKVDEKADSQFLIGLVYEHGADGVSRDLKEAERWYTLAARKIDGARIRLSRLLIEGCYRDPDYDTAILRASSIEDHATRERVYEALHLLIHFELTVRGNSDDAHTFMSELKARAADSANWVSSEHYRFDPRCKEYRLALIDGNSGLKFAILSPEKPTKFRVSPLETLYPYPED